MIALKEIIFFNSFAHFHFILFLLYCVILCCVFIVSLAMTSIVSVTNVNHNIQIKDITFTKSYVEQLIESIHKTIMNELFNAVHSEVQTHQFISKIYKVVSNFKIVLKSVRNVAASRLTAVFDSKLIFQDFSNLVDQVCFEILIYCDSTNRTISVNIELVHLLCVSVLRVHFS